MPIVLSTFSWHTTLVLLLTHLFVALRWYATSSATAGDGSNVMPTEHAVITT
jgi:hypothetical protein